MSVVFLDCTLRDGGYYNNWDFSAELIAEYLKAMSALEIDYVEIGFRSFDTNGFKGGTAYSTDAWIRTLPIPADMKIGVMVNASELVKHPDGVTGALQKLFVPASESPVELVRIPCHIHEFAATLTGCAWLKQHGYKVGINLMQIADRSSREIEDIGKLASAYKLDALYFADSLGSMDPEQTAAIVKSLRVHWPGTLGIHTHDNMGNALANSMRAVAEGVTWIDGTVTGMGRGPGNAKTEYLAMTLAPHRAKTGNITPLLALVNRRFKPMQSAYGWGSNPFYYLAGKYAIHPTYVQELLADTRNSEEDILSAIEHLSTIGGKKYDAGTLEGARHFFKSEARGTWEPAALMTGREVLVLGSGPGIGAHRAAIEEYIKARRPVVLALNTQTSIAPEMIDARAACHPVRLLSDSGTHARLPQQLITPASMLPESVVATLEKARLLDFGMTVSLGTFRFEARHCVIPTSLVFAYALAVATSGKATRILLAGFDGYGADDPRTAEMNLVLQQYQLATGALPVLSITPTRYSMPVSSVYAMA